MLREFGSQFALIIFASLKRRLHQYLCHAMAENEEMAFVDSGPAVVVVLMRWEQKIQRTLQRIRRGLIHSFVRTLLQQSTDHLKHGYDSRSKLYTPVLLMTAVRRTCVEVWSWESNVTDFKSRCVCVGMGLRYNQGWRFEARLGGRKKKRKKASAV